MFPSQASEPERVHTLIVGAGISGIGAAVALSKAGFDDYTVVESSHDIGGTWRDHTYPGLTVDVPALVYSYSFEQKPDWSSMWAPQAEVFAYLTHVTEKHGLRPRIRFGERVTEARFDMENNIWRSRTEGGRTYESRFLINASGFLSTPRLPDIDGMESFGGEVIHTSQWSKAPDLAGKRVAIIGTGATAIQVAPHVARVAASLDVYQRTPIWLMPKPALKVPPWLQSAFARVPGLQVLARHIIMALMNLLFWRIFTDYRQMRWATRRLERLCHEHIAAQVDDPAVRTALTPRYSYGCKRPSMSTDFYPIFNNDNVRLITSRITEVKSDCVVTSDGVAHPADVIICATGYQPFERAALPTYEVYGRDALNLGDYWDDHRYQAFHGYAVHGFPNFFLIYGPYSTAGSSYHQMVETVMRSIIRCMGTARRRGANYIEIKAASQAQDFAQTIRRKRRSIFAVGNCAESRTFYLDRHGDSPILRPGYAPQEWWHSRTVSMDNFILEHRQGRPRTPAALKTPSAVTGPRPTAD